VKDVNKMSDGELRSEIRLLRSAVKFLLYESGTDDPDWLEKWLSDACDEFGNPTVGG